MRILQLLVEKESAIVKKWIDHLLGAFPAGGQHFLKKQGDRFANPLGANFSEGLTALYRALRSAEPVDVTPVLEQLMKLRAVQSEQSPSESLALMFVLKRIVRDECRKEWSADLESEWSALADRLDRMALQAFDLYMASRERLFQVRIKELKSGNYHLTDNMQCPSAMLRKDRESNKAKND